MSNLGFELIYNTYVLLLENDKYYIGTSSDINERLHSHFSGEGAKWTKVHKPKSIIEVCVGAFDVERAKTLEYMIKHGWQNVRGSSWCQVDLKYCPRVIEHHFLSSVEESMSEQSIPLSSENIVTDNTFDINNLHQVYSHLESKSIKDYVYVLQLENDKLYVGSNRNTSNSFERHIRGNGTPWTQTHKPVKIIDICNGGKEEEKKLTLELMNKHGWQNVRGYAWSQLHMKSPPRELRA